MCHCNCSFVAGDVNLWLLTTTTITRYHIIIIIIIIISFPPPICSSPARRRRTARRCRPATEGRYRRRERWRPAALTAPYRPRLSGPTVSAIGRPRPGTLTAATGWRVSAVATNIAFIYTIVPTLLITSPDSIFITVTSSSSNSSSSRMWYKPRLIRPIITATLRQSRYILIAYFYAKKNPIWTL